MDYYDALYKAFAAGLEQQKRKLAASYELERERLGENNQKQLQQAFIRKQSETRDLPLLLGSLGLHGGLAETTAADISNRYDNSRGLLNEEYNRGLKDLALQKLGGMGDIEAKLAAERARLNAMRLADQMKSEAAPSSVSTGAAKKLSASQGGAKVSGFTTVTTPYTVIKRWHDKYGNFLYETYEPVSPAAVSSNRQAAR